MYEIPLHKDFSAFYIKILEGQREKEKREKREYNREGGNIN